MAERRMFAKTIIDSDAFLDMPASTQSLYFHLSMRADDDGFINNPKRISRMINSPDDDLKLLLAKSFILAFESGVIVIKHWKIHNYIRTDRYKGTVYEEEKQLLSLKDNGTYTFNKSECVSLGRPDDNQMETQVRLGKDSIGKDSIVKDKPIRHKYGEYFHVLLTEDQFIKLKEQFPTDYNDRIKRLDEYIQQKGAKYKDHYLTIKKWAEKDTTVKKQGNPVPNLTNRNTDTRGYDYDDLERKLKERAAE